jgi:hypothetical protein
MKAGNFVLAVLVAAVTLTSVAAEGTAATKQRVAIDARVLPQSTFVLRPLKAGALKRDSGTIDRRQDSERSVVRNGLRVMITTNTWDLTGKRGTLRIREQVEWVNIEADGNGDGSKDSVATGTWKVVRGTGVYAGVTGRGRSGHAGLGHPWNARYQGFLTAR